jgi:hypothetical protein
MSSSRRWRRLGRRAHRTADLELATREHERKAAVVREVLLGAIAPVVARAHAESCGIDVSREYVAIRAADVPEERTQRERQLGFHGTLTPRGGGAARGEGGRGSASPR